MVESDQSGTVDCPQCQAANAAVAKFCADCGAPLRKGQAPPRPRTAPPSPPPPPPRGIDFSQFSGGGGNQVRVELDAPTAFNRIVAAIQAAGATITWHAPPHSAKFELVHRDIKNTGGMKVNYTGELTVSEVGPSLSLASIAVNLSWSSMMPVFLMSFGAAFVLVFMVPVYAGFLMLLAILLCAYYAWVFASKVPTDYADKFVTGLPRPTGPIGPGGTPPPQGQDASAADRHPPASGWADKLKTMGESLSTPAGASGGAAGWADKLKQATSSHSASTPPAQPEVQPPDQPPTVAPLTVADRIKQLAELLEVGAITQDEYDEKKAKLLEEL